MKKTEVYTWRLSPVTKAALEEAARRQRCSVAELLEEIVTESLGRTNRETDAEVEQQRRLHARAAQFAGRIRGTDPRRAARAASLVRTRLNERGPRARKSTG